ncbi:hypothetical protein EJB05_10691, partial [Eragrostis curvula]
MRTSSHGGPVVDDGLLQFKCTPPFVAREKSLDPMVMEAHIMMRLCDVGEGSFTPQPDTPSPVANHFHIKEERRHIQPNVDVQTPSIVTCEEEQLIEHELIKALRNLKHTVVTPLSPFISQNSSPEKVSIRVQQEGAMHCNRHRKLKPGVKVRFGYTDRPEYRSLSFVQDGTQYCEVQVTVLQPRTRPDLEPLTVTAFGTQSGDAHQIAARKTLLLFCQHHEEEVRDTPCRYFPLYEHTEAQWQHRLRALQGPDQREEDPTVVASAWYIMAMDSLFESRQRGFESMSPEVAPAPAPAPAYGFLSESDEEPSEEEDAPMAEDDPELELLEDPLQGEEDTESEHEMDYPSDPGSDYSDSMDEDDFPVLEGYVPQYMLEMEEDEDQGVVNFVPVSDDQPVVVDPPAPQQPAPADVPVQQPPALFAPPVQQQPALPAGHQLALMADPAAQFPPTLVALGPLFPFQPVAPAPAPAPAYGFLSESDEEPSEEEDAPMAEDDPELELLEDPLQGEEDTESEHEMDYPSDPGSDYSDSMDEDDFPVLEGYVPQYMLEMEEDEDQGVVNFVPVSDDQPVVVDPPAPQQPAPADVPVQQPPALFAPPVQQQPALPAGHQLALMADPAAQFPPTLVALGPLFPFQPVLAAPPAHLQPAAPQQAPAPQMLGDADLFEYYQLLRAHEEWSDPYDLYRAWRRDHGYDQY